MAHEVVNGANGSVTWCAGPPWCPTCVAAAVSTASQVRWAGVPATVASAPAVTLRLEHTAGPATLRWLDLTD